MNNTVSYILLVMTHLEWVDDENNLKYIEVHLPFDNCSEDESLDVIRAIKKDFKFYEFYLSFGRDHAVEMAGGRTWPTLFLEGYITKMPSFYVYLIDIEVDRDGQRIITVGIAHWLLGIYAEVEITFRIYPECFGSPSLLIYLPFVLFPTIDFKLDYVEQENLTCRQVNFITTTVQSIIDCISDNYFDDRFDTLVRQLNSEHGIWLSTRLMQVLIYNQRLVKIVRNYMNSKCECGPDENQICYCTVWTKELKKINKIYFVDAGHIASNEVFFTTSDQEGEGTA